MTHPASIRIRSALVMCCVHLCLAGLRAEETAPEELFRAAQTEAARGLRLEAAENFRRAAAGFAKQSKPAREAASLYNFALCCHHLGNYQLAYESLDRALKRADAANSPALKTQIQAFVGTVSTFARQDKTALERLEQSLAEARARHDEKTEAWILNDLGIHDAARGDLPRARMRLDESAALAAKSGLPALRTKALVNKSLASLNAWHRAWQQQRVLGEDDPFADEVSAEQESLIAAAVEESTRALDATHALEEGPDRVTALLTVAETWRTLGLSPRAPGQHTQQRAFETLSEAARLAQKEENKPLLCQALGMLAEFYREARRTDEAMKLNEAALRLADTQGVMEDLFRWEWQRGRLLQVQGRREEALGAYERASAALARVRQDIAVGYGNRNLGLSFREAVGGLFFEHADLVLASGSGSKEDAKLEEICARARSIIEDFKSAELEDYFHDDCINMLRARDKDVGKIDAGDAAIIYYIPLADRTEILVTVRGVTERFRSPITAATLDIKATRWRRQLETLGSFECVITSKELSDALVQPIEGRLKEQGVKTLVFVPDGSLRQVPLGALHDGGQFLIEKFAISVTPGLTLTDPSPVTRGATRVLVGALSKSVQGFPALEAVNQEVSGLETTLPVAVLKDEAFLKKPFTEQAVSNRFRVIHIASHGEFKQDSADTFVLTFDDKIHLNELESMIRPRQYEGTPVEILCLSACQTAVGDDRAALGLAGVAVKCGARSALASLWHVSDEVTSRMMTGFYERLFKGGNLSKSEALRQAQISILKDVRFNHPGYWAPYLLIGNWL